MSMVINTNVAAFSSQRSLGRSENSLGLSLQRLSSGMRINSARDDVAGMETLERFEAQIRGMDQAFRNVNDGISLVQTAEGAMSQMTALMQRVRELAVQSSNATNSASDRQAIQFEVSQLVSELDRFAQTTEFNGFKLLDGSFGSASFQVGADANQKITASAGNYRTSQYGMYETVSAGLPMNDGSYEFYQPNTLTINGAQASGSVAVTMTDSAKSVAEKINSLTQTGVRASALTQVNISFTAGSSYNFSLKGINSTAVAVTFTAAANNASGLSAAIEAFNNVSSKTGVTAALNQAGTAITLTAADGSTIVLKETNVAAPSYTVSTTDGSDIRFHNVASRAYTTQTLTIGGRLTLNSASAFTTSENNVGYEMGVMLDAGGNTASSLHAVQNLDVSTYAGAQKAIRIADGAIQRISTQRATFGAVQNRFEATITNLQNSVENVSAARSRIRDADFAAETAALTRAQILQQMGTAMLIQANQLSGSAILSLLG